MKIYRTIRPLVSGSLFSALLSTSVLSVSSVNAETTSPVLNLDTLNKINAKCLQAAHKAKRDVAIAIFDDDGVLLSFVQTDGAGPATGEVARWKGKSAAYYRVKTAETATWNAATAPNIATIQGGAPIFTKDGNAIGGIGVAGAPPKFDENCGVVAIQSVGLVSK